MNKTILITGASRGIGAATAIAAAKRGFAVCINYKENMPRALALEQEITALGARAYAIRADVSNQEDVTRLFKAAYDTLGPIVGLVNNAGILEQQMRLETMSAERINRILSTNVTGTLLCIKEAIAYMSSKKGNAGGSIVNVSSAAAKLGSPREYVDYAASKGAVDTLTIGLAKELAEEGIRVNAVRPAYIYTEMHSSGGEPYRIERLKESIPMKRGGTPEEVANAILWLLSDEASYTTGSFIDVAGGN